MLVLVSIRMQYQEFGIYLLNKKDFSEKFIGQLRWAFIVSLHWSFTSKLLQDKLTLEGKEETKGCLLISAFVEKLTACLFFKHTELLQLFFLPGVENNP